MLRVLKRNIAHSRPLAVVIQWKQGIIYWSRSSVYSHTSGVNIGLRPTPINEHSLTKTTPAFLFLHSWCKWCKTGLYFFLWRQLHD